MPNVAGLGPRWGRIYLDEGYSGASLNRPGLDALRDAAAMAEFERKELQGRTQKLVTAAITPIAQQIQPMGWFGRREAIMALITE
jgi:hypothetical protein